MRSWFGFVISHKHNCKATKSFEDTFQVSVRKTRFLSLPTTNAMASHSGASAPSKNWKNVSLATLACTSFFLLYQFTNAAQHVTDFGSRIVQSVYPATSDYDSIDASLIEHGIDARLTWESGPVPATRLLRHAPGTSCTPPLSIRAYSLIYPVSVLTTSRMDHH